MSALADKLKETRNVLFLVELTAGDEVIRVATHDARVPYSGGTPKLFQGLLTQEPIVEYTYDFMNSIQPIPTVRLSISNKLRLQDRENRIDLDSGYGTIYIWAPDLDWSDIEDKGIFKGRIVKDHHTLDTYSLLLVGLAEDCMKTIPPAIISSDTWPNHRAASGGKISTAGAGQAIPMAWGWIEKGLPLYCVNTSTYEYACHCGMLPSVVDGDYNILAGGEFEKYDNTLTKIAKGGAYTVYPGKIDGHGNLVTIVDCDLDRVTYEPMSIGFKGPDDKTGEFTGKVDALIEHPADIAHCLLINFGKLDPADIDRGSFHTVRNQLLGFKYGTFLNQQIDGREYIERIFKHAFICLAQRGAKLGAFAIQTDAPTQAELRELPHMVGEPVRFAKTDPAMIMNQLQIKYGYLGTSGNYLDSDLIDQYNNLECEKSVARYGLKPLYTIFDPDVVHQTQALQVAQRMLKITAMRHDLITLATQHWRIIDLHLGDVAKLTLRDAPSWDSEGWSEEPCVLVGIKYTQNQALTTWWRIAS